MATSIDRLSSCEHFAIDLDRLPAAAERAGSKGLGVVMMVFAAVWGGFPLVGLVTSPGQFTPDERLLVLVFPVIGAGLFLVGVQQLLWRKRITFDGRIVSVVERGLRGTTTWREPLSDFRGVKRATRRVRRNKRTCTLYLVDLLHPETGKTVNLYTATYETGWRTRWEDYARRLNLPALEERDGGLVAREIADLDKSVTELLGEGKLSVDYDVLAAPAMGLAADLEDDAVVITRTGPRNSPLGWLIACLFPLIFVYVGFFLDDVPAPFGWLFGLVGLFFEVIFVAGVGWDICSRERIRLSFEEVRINAVSPWGETKGKVVPAELIESVDIAREPGRWRSSLVLGSDEGTLTFGQGLPEASLAFVRNAVLAKLSAA